MNLLIYCISFPFPSYLFFCRNYLCSTLQCVSDSLKLVASSSTPSEILSLSYEQTLPTHPEAERALLPLLWSLQRLSIPPATHCWTQDRPSKASSLGGSFPKSLKPCLCSVFWVRCVSASWAQAASLWGLAARIFWPRMKQG